MSYRLFRKAGNGAGMVLLFTLLLGGCAKQAVRDRPLSYDPPGATITTDKPIFIQTYGLFGAAGVWVRNDFEGGRLNRFQRLSDSTFVAHIKAENMPINNSAWYAFKIWAESARRIELTLSYEGGDHRYVPKLSRDGRAWQPIDSTFYAHDTSNGQATLTLDLGPDTLWVAAQELLTSSYFAAWSDSLAKQPWVRKSTTGLAKFGSPLLQLEIGEAANPPAIVLVVSRQHPPEVTGSIAAIAFLEAIADTTALARAFRQQCTVLALPLLNPDGVDFGHWRHNLAGIDLNRDWLAFNQPETQSMREVFLPFRDHPTSRVYFGIDFHSTQQDVFYTVTKSYKTFPEQFCDRWLARIAELLPDYVINEEPSGTENPTSKSWFHETFGVDAVTYEVGDESPRAQIRRNARAAAQAMMELLLPEIEAAREATGN